MFCLQCGKTIKALTNACPYCGFANIPQEHSMDTVLKNSVHVKERREKKPMFTEEQAFAMHIHPDDEMYRKTMELNILSKSYR